MAIALILVDMAVFFTMPSRNHVDRQEALQHWIESGQVRLERQPCRRDPARIWLSIQMAGEEGGWEPSLG